MVSSVSRSRLLLGGVVALVVGFIGVQMYYSMTPARHADHDHAMASLDAGGFLWIEGSGGKRRNLVGKPDRVLVLYFFDPRSPNRSQPAQAARFAESISTDTQVEMLFVARGSSWDEIEARATSVGIPVERLYLDKDAYTADMLGVRRWPETLVYDPNGLLADQAKGHFPSPEQLRVQIAQAKAGVREVD